MSIHFTNSAVRTELKQRSRRRRETLAAVASAQASSPPRNDLAPGLTLEMRPIGHLSVAGRKVRKTTPAQLERLKTAIGRFGFVDPVLITGDGEIVDGHGRVEAAKALGIEAVACVVVDHLSDVEVRTLRIALNRIAEQGEWDFDALQIELEELVVLDAPLDATGFTLPEIETLLLDDEPADQGDEEGAMDAAQTDDATSRIGDVWRLGRHQIVCGDARDPAVYAGLMAGKTAALTLTDPPYNVKISGHVSSGDHQEFVMASGEMSDAEFATFMADWMACAVNHMAPGALLGSFMDWRGVGLVLNTGEKLGLELLNIVVWSKSNGGMGSLWRSQHEMLPFFKCPGAGHTNNVELGRHGRWRSNVWQYPGASSLGSDAREGLADHPTPKPVALLEDALLDITNRDDLVLDPFLGSGSTLIACEKTGRRCRGIELEPRFVDLTVRRWQTLTGKEAMLEETGAGFHATAQLRAGLKPILALIEEPTDD